MTGPLVRPNGKISAFGLTKSQLKRMHAETAARLRQTTKTLNTALVALAAATDQFGEDGVLKLDATRAMTAQDFVRIDQERAGEVIVRVSSMPPEG